MNENDLKNRICELLISFPNCSNEQRQNGEGELREFCKDPNFIYILLQILVENPDNQIIQIYTISLLKQWKSLSWNQLENQNEIISSISLNQFILLPKFNMFIEFYYSLLCDVSLDLINQKCLEIIEMDQSIANEDDLFIVAEVYSCFAKLYKKIQKENPNYNILAEKAISLINFNQISSPKSFNTINILMEICCKFLIKNNIFDERMKELIYTVFDKYLQSDLSVYFGDELANLMKQTCKLANKMIDNIEKERFDQGWGNAVVKCMWECVKKSYNEARTQTEKMCSKIILTINNFFGLVEIPIGIFQDIIVMIEIPQDILENYNFDISLFSTSRSTCNEIRPTLLHFVSNLIQYYNDEEINEIVSQIPICERGITLLAAITKGIQRLQVQRIVEIKVILIELLEILKYISEQNPHELMIVESFIFFIKNLVTVVRRTEYVQTMIKFVLMPKKCESLYSYQEMVAGFCKNVVKYHPECDLGPIISHNLNMILQHNHVSGWKFLSKIIETNNSEILEFLFNSFAQLIEFVIGQIETSKSLAESVSFFYDFMMEIGEIQSEQAEKVFELIKKLFEMNENDDAFHLSKSLVVCFPSCSEVLISFLTELIQNSQNYLDDYCLTVYLSLPHISQNLAQEILNILGSLLSERLLFDTYLCHAIWLICGMLRNIEEVGFKSYDDLLDLIVQEKEHGFLKPCIELAFVECASTILAYRQFGEFRQDHLQRMVEAINLKACPHVFILQLFYQTFSQVETGYAPLVECLNAINQNAEEFISKRKFDLMKSWSFIKMHAHDLPEEEEEA